MTQLAPLVTLPAGTRKLYLTVKVKSFQVLGLALLWWSLAILFSSSLQAASLTCTSAAPLDEAAWGATFVKSLRDLGYVPPQQPVCMEIMFSGVIEYGDAERLESMIQANLPFLGMLNLNSPGGDVNEAMLLGRVARRYYLSTFAPMNIDGRPFYYVGSALTRAPGATCASACFFVWLGGTSRFGGMIGIHRPYPTEAEMRRFSPSDAQQLYRNLSNSVALYLTEMDAAPHWLDDMLRVPSSDILMLSNEQVNELERSGGGYSDVPSMAQWKSARCGALSKKESDDLHQLTSESLAGALPASTRQYRDYLDHHLQAIVKCETQAVILARWQLRSTGTQ